MTHEEVMSEEAPLRFMDIYYKYIELVGGGKEWMTTNREYADLRIREMLLIFSKQLIVKGMYQNSHCSKMMREYGYELPIGNESAMIDSYLATLQMDIDNIVRRMKEINKQKDSGNTLVQLLTQINNINKVYLPYNSILLIEFIEQLKYLKEQQKKQRNGRLNK